MAGVGNRYDVKCHACGEVSIVITEPEAVQTPSFCPICGEQQEEEVVDESGGN